MATSTHQDLQIRTKMFAKQIRIFTSKLPKSILYSDDVKQVIRSSGSIAANYIEAQDAMSRKDFRYRIKICRKEAKETILWLELIESTEGHVLRKRLLKEANELTAIFTTIAKKLDA